jgi:hypothetical protein
VRELVIIGKKAVFGAYAYAVNSVVLCCEGSSDVCLLSLESTLDMVV